MDKIVKKMSEQTIDNPIKDIQFSVIRKWGDANNAETLDGLKVERIEYLFFDDKIEARMVKCAPYDNHFIYEDSSGKPNRWVQMCTCGSSAVCVGYKGYKRDASPTTSADSTRPGEMFVCYLHATTGNHADGSS